MPALPSVRRVNLNRTAPVLTAALAGALALAACGSDNKAGSTGANKSSSAALCGSGSLAAQGSTFQKNIELQWIKDFAQQCKSLTVDYQGTGSGAGIQAFIANQADFVGSDSLMKPDEQTGADKRCSSGAAGSKAIHIPVTAGGIVLVYNLPGVKDLTLSAKTLAAIFQGTITKWNDPAIAAENTGTKLPSTAIGAVHRSDASGSTDVFSKFLDSQSGGAWKLGTGKELSWATSIQAAKGSDGVTQAVTSTEGAITYTELSFAVASNLTPAKIRNAAGEAITADGEQVGKALEAATVDESAGDLRVKLDFGTKSGYPISAVSYAIVCTSGNKNAAGLKAYLTYAVGKGQTGATAIGYASLPSSLGGKVGSAVAAIS
jgi:phosphate transport system substrate-binding protein